MDRPAVLPSAMPARRFPPPWTIDEANNACFIVRDNTGQALGYFYFEEEPGRRSALRVRFETLGRAGDERFFLPSEEP